MEFIRQLFHESLTLALLFQYETTECDSIQLVFFSLSLSISCFRHFIGLIFLSKILKSNHIWLRRKWSHVYYSFRNTKKKWIPKIKSHLQFRQTISALGLWLEIEWTWAVVNNSYLWFLSFTRHKLVYFIEFNHFSFGAHNMKAPYGLRFWPLIIMWSGLWFSILHNTQYERMGNGELSNTSSFCQRANGNPCQLIFSDNNIRNDVCVANSHFKMITLYIHILHFDAVHCSSFIVCNLYGAKLHLIRMSFVTHLRLHLSYEMNLPFFVKWLMLQINGFIAMHSHFNIPRKKKLRNAISENVTSVNHIKFKSTKALLFVRSYVTMFIVDIVVTIAPRSLSVRWIGDNVKCTTCNLHCTFF